MDTILYIIGPTGVGKTSLATELAQKFKGNLVSADSIQVYKGLDIISGKDLDKDSYLHKIFTLDNLLIGTHTISGIPIWCVDLVDNTYAFHVSDYYKAANFVIDRIRKDNIFPIVVGGTTLYVNALLNPIATINIKSDSKLRDKLEKKSIEDLLEHFKKISPEMFINLNLSERGNKRRIIRKIEIAESGNQNIEPRQTLEQTPIIIGLHASREYLIKNIDKRVEERIKNGAFDEAKKLVEIYETLSPQVKNANGYKQIFNYFRNEYLKEEAIQRWKFSEYRHAKNQMTYFKKYITAEWFDVEEQNYKEKVIDFVLKSYALSK